MIGIPAVRHSDTGPVKKSPYELLYIDAKNASMVHFIPSRALSLNIYPKL